MKGSRKRLPTSKRLKEKNRRGEQKKQQKGDFKRLSSLALLVFFLNAESSAAFYDRPFELLSYYSRPDEGFKPNDDFFKSFLGNHLPECQRVTSPAVQNVALMSTDSIC